MKYEELSELIDAWVTETIEEFKMDAMDLNMRNASMKGLFQSILILMTDEERQKIADRMGLKKDRPTSNTSYNDLTKNNGEDAI